MVSCYWSDDTLFWFVVSQCQLTTTWMPNIKEVNYKPTAVCFFQPIIWNVAAILRDSIIIVVAVKCMLPQAIPLAMISRRKSIRGFPLLFYMGMGLCTSSAITSADSGCFRERDVCDLPLHFPLTCQCNRMTNKTYDSQPLLTSVYCVYVQMYILLYSVIVKN